MLPFVAAGNEPQRVVLDRFQWHPHGHVLNTTDEIIRIVGVPRSGFGGGRLLHQHVVVEQLGSLGLHDVGGDLGRRRVPHQVLVLGNA